MVIVSMCACVSVSSCVFPRLKFSFPIIFSRHFDLPRTQVVVPQPVEVGSSAVVPSNSKQVALAKPRSKGAAGYSAVVPSSSSKLEAVYSAAVVAVLERLAPRNQQEASAKPQGVLEALAKRRADLGKHHLPQGGSASPLGHSVGVVALGKQPGVLLEATV